jgi:hypothetical protein
LQKILKGILHREEDKHNYETTGKKNLSKQMVKQMRSRKESSNAKTK